MAPPPVRFDRLAKVKAYHEEAAREELASALADAEARRQEHAAARSAAFKEDRGAGDIADWALADLSHMRALTSLSDAEKRMAKAESRAEEARTGHTSAYQDLRVVERLVEHRREAVSAQRKRAEQKELDELALMLHSANSTR